MIQYVCQNNFNGGIISDDLSDRTNIERYSISVKDSTNFKLTSSGILKKRSGSRYVTNAKAKPDENVIFASFSYSENENYIIELGPHYMRFFKNHAPILNNDGTPYEISTPFSNNCLPNLKYLFHKKKIYFVMCVDFPQILERFSDTNWVLKRQELDGPYSHQITSSPPRGISVKWSSVAGADGDGYQGEINEITSTVPIFDPSDIGRSMQFYSGSLTSETEAINDHYYHSGIITEFIDSQNVFIKWMRPAVTDENTWSSNINSTAFHMSIFGFEREENELIDSRFLPIGFPHAIGSHEGRLIYGNTHEKFTERWGSNLKHSDTVEKIPKFDCFYKVIDGFLSPDDYSYSYNLFGHSLERITWFVEENALLIGTTKDEWTIGSAYKRDPVTPNSSGIINKNTAFGSNYIQAVHYDNKIIFVSRKGNQLLSTKFAANADKYVTESLTMFSNEILKSGITSISGIKDIENYFYCTLKNGNIGILLENEKENIRGWSLYDTDGEFRYIKALPSFSSEQDEEIWVVCKRNNENGDFLTIEVFEKELDDITDDNRLLYPFSDSYYQYSGNLKSKFEGLDRFNGKEVSIVADGKVKPNQVVKKGIVEINEPVNNVIIGLPYNAKVKTLNISVANKESAYSATQSSTGLDRRITEAYIMFKNTLNGFIGTNESMMNIIPFRSTYDDTLNMLPLFTGLVNIELDDIDDENSKVIIESRTPTPMYIKSIGAKVDVNWN